MPSNTIISHVCTAWQPENYVPQPTPPSPQGEFLIEMYVNFMYVPSSTRAGRGMQECGSSYTLIPTIYRSFRQKLEHLVKDSTSWSTISSMLSHVDVPYHLQPLMIARISRAARSIASSSDIHNLGTLPMVVSIRIMVPEDEELQELSAAEERRDRSCIDRLQKVRIGEVDCVAHHYNGCVICLEEIPLGKEAILIPCSHFYHQDCIVNWLQRSSLCPLCRFHIPTGSSDPEVC